MRTAHFCGSGGGMYGLGGWGGTVERHYRPLNRMTHACENITFPQLRWRAVITAFIDITYVPCFTNSLDS